jgi:FAD/FMN-containing dehydrogenase
MFKLLTRPTQNPKTAKGMARGVMTFPLHLAPADLSGFEVCPKRSVGCTAACLNTAGRAGLNTSGPIIQAARIRRTRWYFEDRSSFMRALIDDINRARRYARKRGYDAAFRLNATSDIAWHRVPYAGFANVMELFPDCQFYDYTKVAKRLTHEPIPSNYHLTFSAADGNAHEAFTVLAEGGNVSIVFRTKEMVQQAIAQGWVPLGKGSAQITVIDGDETDLRYLDPKGCVVALYAKGKAKSDQSGFVRDL